MDWAFVARTISQFETYDPEQVDQEMGRLEREDHDVWEAIRNIHNRNSNAQSFMQTSMSQDIENANQMLSNGEVAGHWIIERLLGAGGMGEVYKARRVDGLFDQNVALKLVLRKNKAFVKRFQTERERLANLDHPHIARIVDGGTLSNGTPFMAMEFVDGRTICEYASGNDLNRLAKLDLIERLCEAVAHAHGRLILHRDIKNDNILINDEGQLRLIDFGVSSLIGTDDEAEAGKIAALTFAYAAPEQLKGEEVSAATDIFAIGMLMHLLETGKLPERQSDASVTIDSGSIADSDLSAIISKATATNYLMRYGSADALRDDLQRYRTGFSVSARPIPPVLRFQKLVKRNVISSVLAGIAGISLIAGLVGTSLFALRANEARQKAEEQLLAAEYYLAEAEINANGQSALSKLINEIAVTQAGLDENDLRQFLIKRAKMTYNEIANNPESASAEIYGISKYLGVRGDYQGSSQVLEPLLDKSGIPEITLYNIKIQQARNFRELGLKGSSEKLLLQVLQWIRTKPFLLDTGGYAEILREYALLTLEPAALQEAYVRLLALTGETSADEGLRASNYNSLSIIAQRQKKYEESVEFGIKSFELSKNSDVTSGPSGNIRALNLVYAILYTTNDVETAKKYLPAKEEVFNPEAGHIRIMAYYRWMEILMLQSEGRHQMAFDVAKDAYQIALREHPVGSKFNGIIASQVVEAGALAKKSKEARTYLYAAKSGGFDEKGKISARAKLAEAMLLYSEGRKAAAKDIFYKLQAEDVEDELEINFKYDRFRKLIA